MEDTSPSSDQEFQMEVDPKDLSKETAKELVQIDAITDEEEEAKFKERANLQQLTPKATPTNETLFTIGKTYLAQKYNQVTQSILGGSNQKEYCGTITEVTPCVHTAADNDVKLTIDGPTEKYETQTIRIKQGSTEYANLLAYYGITDPSQMKGKQLILETPEVYVKPVYRLPKNVSLFGRTRYRVAGYCNYITTVGDSGDPTIGLFASSFFLAFLTFALSGTQNIFLQAIFLLSSLAFLAIALDESYTHLVKAISIVIDRNSD